MDSKVSIYCINEIIRNLTSKPFMRIKMGQNTVNRDRHIFCLSFGNDKMLSLNTPTINQNLATLRVMLWHILHKILPIGSGINIFYPYQIKTRCRSKCVHSILYTRDNTVNDISITSIFVNVEQTAIPQTCICFICLCPLKRNSRLINLCMQISQTLT